MSSPTADSSSTTKRKTEEVTAPVDHRKRRRNRTTQSCLNCHGSKRMCDRKRPACSRCVKLGLSGICVYEVDDVAQREPGKDETSHLKERIAELEGFIREFKRKPHPRWAADFKRDALSSSASPARSESDSDDEYMANPTDVADISSSKSDVSLSAAVSPCPGSAPPTPPPQQTEPVFLTSQDNVPAFLFSGSPNMPMLAPDTAIESMASAALRRGGGSEDLFGFPGSSFSDGNDMLERVFSQILHQEECEATSPVSSCECMKKSSAYSVVLALAPHVRRALDSLTALPEHRSPQLHGSCDYYSCLRELDSAISAVVESVSTSLTSSPDSSFTSVSPHQRAGNCSMPLPISNADNYPLGRALSARRSSAAHSFTHPSSGMHEVGHAFDSPRQDLGGPNSLMWSMRQRASSTSMVENMESEPFMSWDPQATGRLPWPRTISL